MAIKIHGIQQMGVGVEDVNKGFKWFRENLGMDIEIFNEKAVAELMLPHTGGQKRERHAILAINMQGGGGFEIWQHTGRKPLVPTFEIKVGDLGISVGKLKAKDVEKSYNDLSKKGLTLLSKIEKNPAGTPHFFVKDCFNNIFEVVENSWQMFNDKSSKNGGIFGAIIGVKDIDDSLRVYRDILKYDKVIYDKTGVFSDLQGVPGGGSKFRRVLLAPSNVPSGAFSPLFGPTSNIELVQALDYEPKDIYKDRMWGDPGFIHLCFDIWGMDELRKEVSAKGFSFTVDSAVQGNTFDMGEAAGGFSYIQAPEGTLIEFVETHKVPIMKKWGWYINVLKRSPDKPLPRLILWLFRTKRVK